MVNFDFDHIVHYTKNPNDVIPFLRNRGIHAVEGGEHQKRPTFNVLSYFDLSYIEFIGTTNKNELQRTEHLKHSLMDTIVKGKFTEGFARFILRTDDIERARRHFIHKGLTVNGPVPLSRKRPDGSVLEWKLLFIGDRYEGLEFPYIIQWGTSDEKLREDLIKREVILPNNNFTFSHITIAVNHLEHTVNKWSNIFGFEVGEKFIDSELQATCQTLKLRGGNIVFCTPTGSGIVSKTLEEKGEKPFQIHLTGHNYDNFTLFGGCYQINIDNNRYE